MAKPHHEDHPFKLIPFVVDSVGATAKAPQSRKLTFERRTCLAVMASAGQVKGSGPQAADRAGQPTVPIADQN